MNENQTITEETQQAVDLIRELVGTYIDHPEELIISVRDFGDQVYWTFKGNSDDYKRIVGAGGTNLAALEFIVKQMGRARNVVHSFRLLDPEPTGRREDYGERISETYDAEPMERLILDLVLACGVGEAKVGTQCTFSRPLTFSFSVYTRTEEDFALLTESPPRARNNLNVMAALGILLRISGHKAGVRFSIAAIAPNDPKNGDKTQ